MSLSDNLREAAADLKLLSEDIKAIINGAKNEKPSSRKSLEPMTRLRKDSEELAEVRETNPQIQFIKDKLVDILG